MRTLVVLLAVAAVGLAAFEKHVDHGRKGTNADALRLVYAYSSNQEELLRPLIREFNDAGQEVAGRRVVVVGESVSSGDAESKIASRTLRAVLWSPASSLWGQIGRAHV